MRIDLVSQAVVKRQVRQDAPGVMAVKRRARVAVRIVVSARNTDAFLIAECDVDKGLIDKLGRVERCKLSDVERGEAGNEVGDGYAVAHHVNAAAQRMVPVRISQVV